MHDIKLIRKNPEMFDKSLEKRGECSKSGEIISLDAQRRNHIAQLENLLTKRKVLSKEVGSFSNYKDTAANKIREDIKNMKKEIAQLEATLKDIENDLENLLLTIPNLLSDDVPFGTGESDNVEVSRWGEIKTFPFKPKEHYEVDATKNDINFEAAATVTGSRFVFLSKSVALLHRALTQYMLNTNIIENELTEFWAPVLVNEQSMFGTGQLPKFREDSYRTNDGLWLIPTAEVPLTNIGKNRIYTIEELPIRMTAATQCFRSEAGSAGKDTTGMIRQHQFEKVEMVHIVRPDQSFDALEEITSHAEEILKQLELPYRVMLLCDGDTGFSATKTHDLEVWLPGQNAYREISSCSNCTDFQARRMKLRYRDSASNKPVLVHTLNGSGLAIGRTLVAVMENYQQADGSILVPKVLRPYMQGIDRISIES